MSPLLKWVYKLPEEKTILRYIAHLGNTLSNVLHLFTLDQFFWLNLIKNYCLQFHSAFSEIVQILHSAVSNHSKEPGQEGKLLKSSHSCENIDLRLCVELLQTAASGD